VADKCSFKVYDALSVRSYQLERPRDLLCSIGRRAWFCDREGNTAVMGVRLMETASQPNGKQVPSCGPAGAATLHQGTTSMSMSEFVQALEHDLQLRGVPFDRADLLAFVVSAWPLIEDDPDVGRWVGAFMEAMGMALA
jgi:hypothetical protein